MLDFGQAPKPKRRPKPVQAPDCACAGTCRGSWDVVLIGCGSEKAPQPAAAGDLYTGPLYSAHRRVLEHLNVWPPSAILSALHGWVEPDRTLAPYEHQLAGDRADWGDKIACRILACTDAKQPLIVLVLAGGAYIDPWVEMLSEDDVEMQASDPAWGLAPIRAGEIIIDDPLRGMEVGERLQFAADFVNAGGSYQKSPRCTFHAFVRRWCAGLEERRAGRRAVVERRRRARAAQLGLRWEASDHVS